MDQQAMRARDEVQMLVSRIPGKHQYLRILAVIDAITPLGEAAVRIAQEIGLELDRWPASYQMLEIALPYQIHHYFDFPNSLAALKEGQPVPLLSCLQNLALRFERPFFSRYDGQRQRRQEHYIEQRSQCLALLGNPCLSRLQGLKLQHDQGLDYDLSMLEQMVNMDHLHSIQTISGPEYHLYRGDEVWMPNDEQLEMLDDLHARRAEFGAGFRQLISLVVEDNFFNHSRPDPPTPCQEFEQDGWEPGEVPWWHEEFDRQVEGE